MRSALLALLLAACAAGPAADDTAPPTDTDTGSDTGPGPDTDPSTLSWVADVYRPFLEESCSGCHVENGYIHPPIVADGSHLREVGPDGMPYVTPGALDRSLLWYKITDRQGEIEGHRGERMPPPPDEDPLPAEAIATIEAWILDGAHD